jgi:tyrosyl-tRNA synthetase
MPSDLERLLSGAEEVIPVEDLGARLSAGRALRVKLGIDPSRPDLHLGHAVVLRKLRQFQDLGHKAVLIIGDFTGRVGDPTGQSETRPLLGAEEMEANAASYLDQASLVIDMDAAEVRHNSEWLAPLGMEEVLRLTSSYTVARMLERDDFDRRYRDGRPISVVEFLYPLMQAYDSVMVRSDVELGGTDQTFNLLVGRDLQRAYGQEPQVVLTMPLLEGTDGERKMSKSYDNYVGLTQEPDEMFGRLMRVPDDLIAKYMRLCTAMEMGEVERVEAGLADGTLHPAAAKRSLAREVVDLYHGSGEGERAESRFDVVHRDREIPEEVQEISIPPELVDGGDVWLPRLMTELGLASSNSEARRLISQGGVRLDGETVSVEQTAAEPLRGRVLQVGRRRFVRLT